MDMCKSRMRLLRLSWCRTPCHVKLPLRMPGVKPPSLRSSWVTLFEGVTVDGAFGETVVRALPVGQLLQ